MTKRKLARIYHKLHSSFGKQYWWPARTKLEVMIGAMLTQNTSWPNVEKAISNLKKKKFLSFKKLSNLKTDKLAALIKSAGYFNIKARRLKNLLEFINKNYKGNLSFMQKINTYALREELLNVNGVGQETADSILLYAFNKPIFVIDAYTKRIFSRLNKMPQDIPYQDAQNLFMKNLAKDSYLFNEYHALIVKLGKDYCKKNKPLCHKCPIRDEH
ncbi:MAG: endonuclease III domain-containing protein [Candidatus Omnitrophica bacterium]|nr:endonuclease III domain-containing protein [Candidatus Omnitrophota bacterium]